MGIVTFSRRLLLLACVLSGWNLIQGVGRWYRLTVQRWKKRSYGTANRKGGKTVSICPDMVMSASPYFARKFWRTSVFSVVYWGTGDVVPNALMPARVHNDHASHTAPSQQWMFSTRLQSWGRTTQVPESQPKLSAGQQQLRRSEWNVARVVDWRLATGHPSL